MTKKYYLILLFVLISGIIPAQNAWRTNEMQVKVRLNQPQNGKLPGILSRLKIDSDYVGSFIRCYVVPEELDSLQKAGLETETEIPDLNRWSASFGPRGVPSGYYTVAELNEIADSLAINFPDICTLHPLGVATGMTTLMALKISGNSALDENEAEVLFDGGIHGDEVGGPENMIRFARDLCTGYNNDPVITDLVNTREIWIYYCVNPYGRNTMTRYNGNGVDINRDCGYMWNAEGNSAGAFSQPETRVYRNLLADNQFAIHCSYHSGTEFISYPWSYRAEPTPDNDIHDYLSTVYASNSGYSNIPHEQGYTGMYAINGSTKDFGYGALGDISWSIEISVSKQPAASQIVPIYMKNKTAMLKMVEYAGYGIEGVVTDSVSGLPVPATLFINDYFPFSNDPEQGDYHKFLLPGTYQVRVISNGYKPKIISGVQITQMNATELNISLSRENRHFARRIISCQIPNNNFMDEGNTPAAIGPPDTIQYSIGRNGFAVLDMGDTLTDHEGADILVYENDNTPEGYQLLASTTMDGPWMSLGYGSGNQGFDLASGSLTSARYIKIKDDGDGQSNVADAGFDLDAVEGIFPQPQPDSTGFIRGTVYSFENPEPINGAYISCGINSTWSDENGHYLIAADTGTIELCGNYAAAWLFDCDTLFVSPGDTTDHDLYLLSTEQSPFNEPVNRSFLLSPNPARDYTLLTLNEDEAECLIALFSAEGKVLYRTVSTRGMKQTFINTSAMSPGLYLVKIQTQDRVMMLRLLISR